MEEERRRTDAIPYEQADELLEEEGEENEEIINNSEKIMTEEKVMSGISCPKLISQRQTLLFSATALRAEIATKKSNKDKKWLDKVKIKGIGSGAVKSLPLHLQQLLSVVAVMNDTRVADVTGGKGLVGVGSVSGKESEGETKEKGKEGKGKEKGQGDKSGSKGEEEGEEVWDGKGEGKNRLNYSTIHQTKLPYITAQN